MARLSRQGEFFAISVNPIFQSCLQTREENAVFHHLLQRHMYPIKCLEFDLTLESEIVYQTLGVYVFKRSDSE